jgi:pyrroloquinoline quinone biosynthesis protein D
MQPDKVHEMAPIDHIARPRLSTRARLQTDKVTGNPMLLYPEGVLMLNPTGHAIVSLCSGTTTVQQMIDHLAARYGTTPQAIGPDVTAYLQRLRAKNLLHLCDDAGNAP